MPKFTGLARCSVEYSYQFTVEAATKEEALPLLLVAAERYDVDEWESAWSPIEVDEDEVEETEDAQV